MGYDSTHAKNYKNGKVDVKAECRDYIQNMYGYEVMKDSLVGSRYYAAVKHDEEVSAFIILTKVNNNDYFNITLKCMDETMYPYYFDCPVSILNMLTKTENKLANEWREKCFKDHEHKKAKKPLPIGSVVLANVNGQEMKLTRCAPAYQFKRPFWMSENGCYVPATWISEIKVIA